MKRKKSNRFIDEDYYALLIEYDTLSRDEERELFREYYNGSKEAFDKLVKHNLRLVVDLAKKLQDVNPYISIMDLIEEGTCGLIRAIKRFDYTMNTRLATYAYNAIRNDMLEFIYAEYRMKKTLYFQGISSKLKEIEKKLFTEFNRMPTLVELTNLYNKMNDDKISIDFVKNIKSLNESLVTVSDLSDEDNDELVEYVPDDSISVEEQIEQQFMYSNLRDIINGTIASNLADFEREILALLYGFNGPKMGYSKVGLIYDLSAYKIKRIESKAIEKIKNNVTLNNLLLHDEKKKRYGKRI